MTDIATNIDKVLQRIRAAADISGRTPDKISLLAVSKRQSTSKVEAAFRKGLTHFGENYLQESLDKIQKLANLPIEWHFIGPVQSNKTRKLAENFDWVHTIDRLKTARRLNDQRPEHLPPLQICLQVNIDGDPNKTGISPEEAGQLALELACLPRLQLRGLMCIPARTDAVGSQVAFTALADLQKQLQNTSPRLANLDTLSMGMSEDLEVAIGAGATIVRIGTDIFGPRNYNSNHPANLSDQE